MGPQSVWIIDKQTSHYLWSVFSLGLFCALSDYVAPSTRIAGLAISAEIALAERSFALQVWQTALYVAYVVKGNKEVRASTTK